MKNIQLIFYRAKCLMSLMLVIISGTIHAQSAVPFEVTPQGHILIKAKINGVEGNFIFDTGGGLTLATKRFADQLGQLHQQDGNYTSFRATGEKLSADLYDARSLTIGSFEEKAPVLTIFDVNLGGIDGIVSLKTFRHQPFTIDYVNKKIIFETSESLKSVQKAGHTVSLQLADDRGVTLDVFALFTVNDKLTLQFLIDSGAGKDIYRLNARYIQALHIDTATATKTVHASEFNPAVKTPTYSAKVHSIAAKSAPAVQCREVTAAFIDGLIYDGVVCLNWIGKGITFDLENQRMIVR